MRPFHLFIFVVVINYKYYWPYFSDQLIFVLNNVSCFTAKKSLPKKGGKKRGGKKKKNPPKVPESRSKQEVKYTEEDLKKAIALVKSGESAWKISRQFGIKYNILAAATKISMYGLMYSKCKGEETSKEDKKEKEKVEHKTDNVKEKKENTTEGKDN